MRRSAPSMFFRTGPILRSRRSPSRSRRTLGVEASGSPAVSVGKRSVDSSLVGCFTCPPPPASGIERLGALRTVALAFQANTPEAWMATLRSVLLSKATSLSPTRPRRPGDRRSEGRDPAGRVHQTGNECAPQRPEPPVDPRCDHGAAGRGRVCRLDDGRSGRQGRGGQDDGLSVVAAAEDLAAKVRSPDSGNLGDDLVALLRDVIRVYTKTVAGRITPGLLADMAEHPELADAIGGFWAGRRELMLEVLRRGISRGELRPDIDLELAADLLYGPIYYRLLVTRAPLTIRFADQVVDAVLRGKATHAPPTTTFPLA